METQIRTGALPLIMGNYASNFGINLFMYGASAYTDGKNITIPRLNFNNEDEMDMAFGYVAHECGHVRYSDFSVIGKSFDGTEALRSLFNALEDTRIEYLQIKNWPGLRKTFNHLITKLDESICKYLRTCKNKTSLITVFFDCSNRVNCLNQSAENSLKMAKNKLKKILPETLISALQKKARMAVKCHDSEEVLELSREIMNSIMKTIDFINDQKAKKDNAKGQTDLFDNSLSESIKQEFDGMPEANEKQTKALEKEFDKILSKMKDSIELDNNLDRKHPDLANVIEACSAQSVGAVDIGSLVTRNSAPADNLSLYKKVLSENSLRNNIHHLVKGYEDWNIGSASCGKTLDVRRYQCSLGISDRVFKKKLPKKALNTSIHLLVDISGSMSRPCHENSTTTRSQVANHVALSLAMSLENIKNVDNRVIYFPGNYCEYEEVYHSGQPLVERATYFDLKPRGCTPLAQTLLYSMHNMPCTDKYHRNIIIVITDGEPDNYQFARDMLAKAKSLDIEVYALRIAPNQGRLKDLFEEQVDMLNASELPDAMTTLLADKIFNCR